MGTLFSCFSRPTPAQPHMSEITPISHPYPLASRQRALSEYHPPSSPFRTPLPISHPRPHPRVRRASGTGDTDTSPSTPTSSRPIPPAGSHRARSTSMASSFRSFARSHGPMRVHEIPFPLLSYPVAVPGSSSSSGPNSVHGSPVRQAKGLPAESATALLPVLGDGDGGSGRGWAERRRLKKVQVVEKDWELWRADDWVGYGVRGGGDERARSTRAGMES